MNMVYRYTRLGSIPACAGEPSFLRPPSAQKQVYPRVCGGTLRTCYLYPVGDGLSPRVRGNQSYEPASEQGGRSIPACAGEP